MSLIGIKNNGYQSAPASGVVFDVRRYSVHDGPGIRTTVFLKGCPLNCWWCHNPESQRFAPQVVFRENRCTRCGICQDACTQNAIIWQGDMLVTETEYCTECGDCAAVCPSQARELAGKRFGADELVQLIRRDVTFYDESSGGVTFSGGEPLIQADFLREVLQACRQEEIHTALDTCGYAPWKVLDYLRQNVDLFLYDLKIIDEVKHRKYTGVSNRVILENLQKLAEAGHAVILRFPLIPGFTDSVENIHQIGEFAGALPNILRIDILPYHDTARLKYLRMGMRYGLPEDAAIKEEQIITAERILTEYGLETKIGG